MKNVEVNTAALNVADRMRPKAPIGDERDNADTALNEVLVSTVALIDGLRAIATRQVDKAPASTEHVLALTAALSHTVLEWIEGVAVVRPDLSIFLLTWLLWLGLSTAAYGAILLCIDASLAAWKHRRQQRRQLLGELAQIDRHTEDALLRIGEAFHVAQRAVRENAVRERNRH